MHRPSPTCHERDKVLKIARSLVRLKNRVCPLGVSNGTRACRRVAGRLFLRTRNVECTVVSLRYPLRVQVAHSVHRTTRVTLRSEFGAPLFQSNSNNTHNTTSSCPQKIQSIIEVDKGPGIMHRKGGSILGTRLAHSPALYASVSSKINRTISAGRQLHRETTTERRNLDHFPPVSMVCLRVSVYTYARTKYTESTRSSVDTWVYFPIMVLHCLIVCVISRVYRILIAVYFSNEGS
jgi:hypothetical protein